MSVVDRDYGGKFEDEREEARSTGLCLICREDESLPNDDICAACLEELRVGTRRGSRMNFVAIRNLVFICLFVLVFFWAAATAPAANTGQTRIAAMQARAKPIICQVFGRYCQQALRVSWCESRHYKWAVNGQYRGLFQMGSWERETYGHAPGAWAQARAARRYFVASGRDWSPWECQP